MKEKIIIVLLIGLTCLNPTALFSQSKKEKKAFHTLELKITGMTCEVGCANGIESSVYKIKGVKKSKVNFDAQTATIIFDKNKTSQEEIIKAIENFNPGGKETDRKYLVTFVNITSNEK